MHRIEAEQVGRRGRITRRIVDMNDLDAGPAPEGPKDEAADAAEAVDADVHEKGACAPGIGDTIHQRGLMDLVFHVTSVSFPSCLVPDSESRITPGHSTRQSLRAWPPP